MTEEREETGDQYRIRLEIFEGPLDLLLHLIKKNELDIYDIPISLITQQYLEYLEIMKQLNLDIAGEFLVMAAELMHIKSRTLLPTPPPGEGEEEEGPDPRAELVRRLLEYQQFKDVADQLRERDLLGRDTFVRGAKSLDWLNLADGMDLEPVSIFQLVEAFRQLLAEAPAELVHEITIDLISVRERILQIMDAIKGKQSFTFRELFEPNAGRPKMIITFLAILELVRISVLRIHQDDESGTLRMFNSLTDDAGEIEGRIKDDYLG
jgi:segregation and condensation protein A